MRYCCFFYLLIGLPYMTNAQIDEPGIGDLKAGRFKEDTSYIYTLPFEHRKKVFLIQAYESKMSHRGERALDFKIKKRRQTLKA